MGDVPEMSKKTIRGLVGEENGALYIKLGGFWYLLGEKRSIWMYRTSFAGVIKDFQNGWIHAWKDEDMHFSKRPAIREFSCE